MKERFPGYYRPTETEFEKMWEECFFLPDANILLHLFRYGANTRAQVLEILRKLKPRVWIPYRVGLEFHRRWRDVDQTNRDAYDKLSEEISAQGRKLKAIFDEYTRHQTIDAKHEQETIETFVDGFRDRLSKSKAKHPSRADALAIFHQVSDLIGDAVGQRPTAEEIQKVEKEGQQRYALLIPPGYRDAKKEGLDKYGDLFIWREALEKAKIEKKPVIVITDDVKEDWWQEFRGEKIGPRAELLEEMREYAGQQFYLYTLSQFLDYAKKFLKQPVDADAIDEIKSDEKQIREKELRDTARRTDMLSRRIKRLPLEDDVRARIELFRQRLETIDKTVDVETQTSSPNTSNLRALFALRESVQSQLTDAEENLERAILRKRLDDYIARSSILKESVTPPADDTDDD